MHEIEPHYRWKDEYNSARDKKSPFYGMVYEEFKYTNKIYNYYIHPQWDHIGSETLYVKITYVDYDKGYAIIELIGEWNDCLHNDIMMLKRNVVDLLLKEGIYKFVLLCDNVMNFHASDDAYYEEWYEDVSEEGGWLSFVNVRDHVLDEMNQVRMHFYVNLGEAYNDIFWQKKTPKHIVKEVEIIMSKSQKSLH